MQADIDRILIPRKTIAHRVGELAHQITADFSAGGKGDADITIVAVMTGALVFCGDLIRQIPIPMKIGLIMVSSYPGTSTSAKEVQVMGHRLGDVHGRDVLVVDDILDSGGTISRVGPIMLQMGAKSVKSCVLLRKDRPTARAIAAEYVGFEIPDEFVVGYGLDFGDRYRNLPDIVTLKQSILNTGERA